VPRITYFCICIYVFGCKLNLFRLCCSDFGITPVDDITFGITWTAICFHKAHISFVSSLYFFCLSVIVLARLCVFGTAVSIKNVFFVFLFVKVLWTRIELNVYHHYHYSPLSRNNFCVEFSEICRFVRKIAKSLIMSVCPFIRRNISAPTGQIFMKVDIWIFFENMSRKFKFHLYLTKIIGFYVKTDTGLWSVSPSFLLRLRNVSDKSCKTESKHI